MEGGHYPKYSLKTCKGLWSLGRLLDEYSAKMGSLFREKI